MRLRAAASALLGVLLLAFTVAPAFADDGGDITGANRHSGGITISGSSGRGGQPVSEVSGPSHRSFACGASSSANPACEGAIAGCTRAPLPPPSTVVVTEEQQPDGSWRQISVDCDGNGGENDTIAVTAAMVREEVVRLLPPVAVGVAPADGPTLVNLETIFWSPTPATRGLGPVTILGQTVAITIRFDHATYDYGDGTTDTTPTPGTAWTRDACDTAQCPTLQGHTYTHPTDTLTARSTITWTATFTVTGGPEQPIPGTIDGPTSTHDLQVLEGRSVIVR